MSRKTYGQEMQQVKDEILFLGSMVEDIVMESVKALKDNDLDRSRQVLADDLLINKKRFEIESTILILMATQQSIAGDLRALTASLGICTELERMGDYAKGIATVNLRTDGLSMPFLLHEIQSMAEKTVDMLHRALSTFVEEDIQAAENLIQYDNVIDDCYARIYSEALNNVIQDPRNIERANYVIWVAHHLERLGDRATNICERVIYTVTGEHLVLTRPQILDV